MSRTKPVETKAGAITKAEFERRKRAEDTYKGVNPISETPPESLSEEGKEVYSVILRNLPLELMNETDGYAVEVVADAIANMRLCRADIRKNGLVVLGAPNKYVPLYQKYSDILKKYISELGLSPAARSRIASIANQEPKTQKKTLMDLLNEDDGEDEG